VGEDLSAALGHPMEFGLFHMQTEGHGRPCDDHRNRESPLTAYTTENDIAGHDFLTFLSHSMHSRTITMTDTPS